MSALLQQWAKDVVSFLLSVQSSVGSRSVPNGATTLYGTCYAWMGLYYLGQNVSDLKSVIESQIRSCQNPDNGFFEGPELKGYIAHTNTKHNYCHLLHHVSCSAVLPVVQQLDMLIGPLHGAHVFCSSVALDNWQKNIDWKHAWLEGNNILFVGQLLVYLRDVEKHPGAAEALKLWFDWLDRTADPKTGLWGTNGFCSPMEAVYGGYHQLLVYYHENHPLPNAHGLVDTVLALQHSDGGFNPNGNGGACEDVDSVDILVNCYKRIDYRRAEIRYALRRCLKHILSAQNPDGGFPYNRNQRQSHMGIPATEAGPNVSCTFPTWFRIHTLALIAEVLPNDPALKGIPFCFNKALSMGWHANPPGWEPVSDAFTIEERIHSVRFRALQTRQLARYGVRLVGRYCKRLLRNRLADR